MDSICVEGFIRGGDEKLERCSALRSAYKDENSLNIIESRQATKEETCLSWNDVRYSIMEGEKKTNILKGVSGEARSGEVIAIMGGSGAGKTTLLNVLAGRVANGELTADIRINGQKRSKNWHRAIGYVLQDTALYPNLTVRETVIFTATLKLRASMSQKEKINRADEVIAMMGLKDVANNYIGGEGKRGISGGQRRRVTVAIQLVSNPRILFLDEPTTGLDSLVSFKIVKGLRALAVKDKKLIVLTIHQPRTSILLLFEKILLLSRGQTVFFGKVNDALEHFKQHGFPCPTWLNPADFFLDIITPDYRTIASEKVGIARLEILLDAWGKVEAQRKLLKDKEEANRVSQLNGAEQQQFEKQEYLATYISPFAEIKYLFQRRWKNTIRNRTAIKADVINGFILLVCLCATYFQMKKDATGAVNRIGMLFLLLTSVIYVTTFTLLSSFATDRAVILQERYDSVYRVSSFFIAALLASLPNRIATDLVLLTVAYYVTGLRTDGFQHFLVYMATLLLTLVSSAAMGLFIGAFFRSPNRVFSVGGLIITILFSFMGNYANSDSISWIFRWIQYLCNGYYPYRALVQNEFIGLSFSGIQGETYVQQYALSTFSFWSSCLALVVMTIAFVYFGCLALNRATRPAIRLV